MIRKISLTEAQVKELAKGLDGRSKESVQVWIDDTDEHNVQLVLHRFSTGEVISVAETPLVPCPAKVTFYPNPEDKECKPRTTKCCLFTPHKGIRHYSPSILLTCGGERATEDINGNDITETWSPFIDDS